MNYSFILPVFISFVVSAVLGPVLIPFLRNLKLSQTERELGVKSHLKKAGTPTMGGILFLIGIAVTCLIYLRQYPKIVPVLFLTLGFGIIGFLDDYLKVVLRRSDGLLPWQKLIGEIVVTAIFAYYLIHYTDVELTLLVPFSHGYYWNIGILAIPMLFVILGIAFIIGTLIPEFKKNSIKKHGDAYKAKIYGYVENTSYRVNGRFPINVKVHYFDKKGIEWEAVLPAGMPKGSGEYPIGMTMDIYEYRGKYSFDPKSVRDEILPGEAELMDDKPVDPSRIKMTAVSCRSCGASYQAVAGYTGRCPYCGSYQNVGEI